MTHSITVEPSVIADMLRNPLTATTLGDPMFVEDEILPVLLSFDLDINNGVLRLTFSESVNSSSINSTQLTLQSSSVTSMLTSMYTLMDDSSVPVIEESDGVVLVFTLTDVDLNNIKQIVSLATNENNTFIS